MTLLLRRVALCNIIIVMLLSLLTLQICAATETPFKILTNTKNVIVWQRFGQWLMITEDLAAGRVCYYFDPYRKSKLNLKEALPGNWMPLGSAIKWLMYVDHYQDQDRLMAHDVDWHAYYIANPSSQNQIGCGMTDITCVYGQYRASKVGDHYPVDLYNYNVQIGSSQAACISDSEKTQFAHDGNLIVYRAYYSSSDTRIYGHYFNSTGEFEIAARNGIEPSVCGNLVAWAEVNGAGYNIVAKNLETGEIRTIAYTTAISPCPEAGHGSIFWEDARNSSSTGLDIYGYDWQTRQEYVVTNAAGDQTHLRVCDDLVTWVTGPTSLQTLWGAKIQVPVIISDLRAAMVTENSVKLSWTSAGSTSNPPVSYDLRTRTDGPITDSNWSTSTPITGLPTPQAQGTIESFAVPALAMGYHHFAIKAKLQNGDYSLLSNCVSTYLSQPDDVFTANDGAYVSFSGVVSGAETNGSFYCQQDNGVKAAKIIPLTGQSRVSSGQSVTVTGRLSQDADQYGPIISDSTITSLGTASLITPLGMANRAVGGCDPKYGGTSDHCASNLWLLVKTWGRVSDLATGSGGCSFYINDGSLSGNGVYVTSSDVPSGLRNGSYVTVEGVSIVSRTRQREIKVMESSAIRLSSS